MQQAVIYFHGKGGSAEEAEHYRKLFKNHDVIGFDYQAQTPWEARAEFPAYFDAIVQEHGSVILVANSIGAYFAMHALSDKQIEHAFFISPIVDMEQLICDMMHRAGVSEQELRAAGEIRTETGEMLSWVYLCYVREHPICWRIPTSILYGAKDQLTAPVAMTGFAGQIGASLTVMENGEHWFHTEEQMQFLDRWILRILNTI